MKFFRSIVNWEWYDDANTFRMFFHLIVTANHETRLWKGRTIKRGQRLTTIRRLADELNIDEKTVQRCLRNLESTKEIKTEPSKNGTLITVRKYNEYQANDTEDVGTIPTQPPTPTPTQPPTQPPTKQEYKKGRMEEGLLESPDGDSLSGCDAPPTPESINFENLVANFNRITKGVFGVVQLPLSEQRKKCIRARIREHGKEKFMEVVRMATASDFLRGQNPRGFTATFDWLIKPSNFEKVLSGNYANSIGAAGGQYKGDSTIGSEFTRKM